MSSNVKSAGFKFEFSFSEILDKPTSSDINSIQAILKNLIEQELPIYTTETSDLESDLAKFPKVPLRRLKDVLYPLKVRVVSVGAPWQDHVDGKESEDFSAELCCGSHATNTNQLKEIVIRSFSANGTLVKVLIYWDWEDYFREFRELLNQNDFDCLLL